MMIRRLFRLGTRSDAITREDAEAELRSFIVARVEQLTKTTGNTILLTKQCVDALASPLPGLIDRGFHVLKGKSAAVQVFSLDEETDARADLTS